VSPDELRAYLEVIKASGLGGRVEIVGKLVVDTQPVQGPLPPALTEEHPVVRDLRELFPGGLRPSGA